MPSTETTPLYEDRYVTLHAHEIILKTYYFPTCTNKKIAISNVRQVYYKKQEGLRDLLRTKGWGMACTKVWWACDLSRQHGDRYNIVIDIGSAIKCGFTVEDMARFMLLFKPLTKAPFTEFMPSPCKSTPDKAEFIGVHELPQDHPREHDSGLTPDI